jgi:hypothetical protein
MARIALVTCADIPEPDHDEAPALEALRACGHDARALAWDEPGADPGAFDVCVLRSTWNYIWRPVEFLTWVRDASVVTRLFNPPRVVEANHHKRYLIELARSGVPTVPTVLLPAGEPSDPEWIMEREGWPSGPEAGVVVKPAVGGWSWNVRAFGMDRMDQAAVAIADAAARGDVLVQPIVEAYAEGRERSIVWIDGDVTHVVTKGARLDGEEESVGLGPMPSRAEMELVTRCLAPYEHDLMYARVDVVPDARGRPLVGELELIEPSLWFRLHPPALDAFVAAIERRLA